MKLFIIVLVSMCIIAFAMGMAGVWFLMELVRFAAYCTAQGGQC